MSKQLVMTPTRKRLLREAYEEAVKTKSTTFTVGGDTWDGEEHEFLTDYAKYLLQYLDMQGMPEE